jgi:threonine/homoserine efflux transporter RhtA
MITKPDANPIVFALGNWAAFFLFGAPVGYFLMGQMKKAIGFWIATVVFFPCFGIGAIFPWIAAYDAYLLGQKLAAGESITPNTNGLSFLDAIFKD